VASVERDFRFSDGTAGEIEKPLGVTPLSFTIS